jgi:superfamily I DNA and RNA helicase
MAFNLPNKKDLNKIQVQIISEIKNRDKLAVIGGPGTGKTIIAIQGLNEIIQSKANKSSKIVVYSKPLQQFIDKNLSKLENEKLSSTYHSWINTYILDVFGRDSQEIKSKFKVNNFDYNWKELNEYLKNLSEERTKKYDFFFIDEAQDLPIELIEIISRSTNKIFVTYDDAQKIGNENSENIENFTYAKSDILSVLKVGEQFYDLIDNFRNTTQIEQVAKLYWTNYDTNDLTLNHTTTRKIGPKPSLVKSSNLEQTVRYIISEFERNPTESQGVLIPYFYNQEERQTVYEAYKKEFELQIAKRKLADKIKFKFKYRNESNINLNNILESGLFLMTFKTSKGLEFDSVYIIETDKSKYKTISDRNSFYVALTRARRGLNIIYSSSDSKNDLVKIALDNSTLFNIVDISKNKDEKDDALSLYFKDK